jgi:hypothetical protein
MKGPNQYRGEADAWTSPSGSEGAATDPWYVPVPLAEESRTYAESPAFNLLRASASKTAQTRYARKPRPANHFGRVYRGVRASVQTSAETDN